MFSKIMLFFLSIFCLLLAFYSGIQYQRKTQTQIKYITQEKPITTIPKEDLMKRCGPIPDEIPSYGHFDIVSGPFWSPDCRYIAWSVFASETSYPDPISAPLPVPETQEGIYLYSYMTKKIQKVYAPQSRGETIIIEEWKNNKTIPFKKEYIPLLYNISDESIIFSNPKLGYQFTFPKDWTLRDEDKSGNLYMLYKNQGKFIEFQNEMRFELKPYQTIEDFLRDTQGFGGIYEETNVNGYMAYIKKITGQKQGELEKVGSLFIKHNNKYLSIIYSGLTLEEIWPILNTFSFTR